MPLQPGQRLAHYEVHEKIGEGGMGEVYRATDTRLARDVALKALPDDVARDPERLARFRREAQLLAALNHPNIAAIHGLEEIDAQPFLALELVPGDDLAARLKAGALPLQEALGLARQIAEALEEAHEQGIIHRDLKPANIKITPGGKVKILDFGLAKALDPLPGRPVSASLSPTMTAAATRAGIILGTAAYMSPEQARGAAVDRRADIWAFGCVLLEMITGRSVFSEPTVSDTLASVLKSDPDWNALPAAAPRKLRHLLRRCLQKDAMARLRDIGEARIALQEILSGAADGEPAQHQSDGPAGPDALGALVPRWRWPAIVAGAVVLTAVATFLASWSRQGPLPSGALRKLELATEDLRIETNLAPSLSPDGRRIVHVSGGQLWVRELDRIEPRRLTATDNAQFPFWSPDGEWVVYVRGNDLWKVPAQGGEATVIVPAIGNFTPTAGLAWGRDGKIIYSRGDTGLFEVPAIGGEPREILATDATESDLHQPSLLPGERGVLFVAHRVPSGADTIVVFSGGKRREILQIANESLASPIYSTSGHILYRRRGARAGLWAIPFALERLEATGEPFLVAQDADYPSTAADGALLYVRGATSGQQQLVWVNREGAVESTVGQPQTRIGSPAISADGERVAVMAQENENWDIWIHDMARGTRTRLTFTQTMDWDPSWSPDGERVIFWDGATRAISSRSADGTGEVERLVAQDLPDSGVPSMTPDGKQMVFWARPASQVDDLWIMPMEGERKPAPLIQTAAREDEPRISPDGKHMVYVSNESGRSEIYLTRFPTGEGKWQVSVEGGTVPRWNARGDRLYFLQGKTLLEVAMDTTAAIRIGKPEKLFDAEAAGVEVGDWNRYDVHPDGRRFLMVKPLRQEGEKASLVLVDHWYKEFAAR